VLLSRGLEGAVNCQSWAVRSPFTPLRRGVARRVLAAL